MAKLTMPLQIVQHGRLGKRGWWDHLDLNQGATDYETAERGPFFDRKLKNFKTFSPAISPNLTETEPVPVFNSGRHLVSAVNYRYFRRRNFLTWLFNSKLMILLGPLLITHSLGGFPCSVMKKYP